MDRRTFVKSSVMGGAGLLLHGAISAQSDTSAPALPPIETHGLPQVTPSLLGMPGLFPGRVVEVSNANAIARNSVAKPDFFFSSRRRHTRLQGDWSSDVCSSD